MRKNPPKKKNSFFKLGFFTWSFFSQKKTQLLIWVSFLTKKIQTEWRKKLQKSLLKFVVFWHGLTYCYFCQIKFAKKNPSNCWPTEFFNSTIYIDDFKLKSLAFLFTKFRVTKFILMLNHYLFKASSAQVPMSTKA